VSGGSLIRGIGRQRPGRPSRLIRDGKLPAEAAMSRFVQDCRFAWRTLVRGRSVTGFAVLTVALGIGITTSVFSLFYSVLLRPLPYPHADELVVVYGTQPACPTCPTSFEEYADWRARNTVFSAIGGSSTGVVTVNGLGDPHRIAVARVT